MQQVKYQAGVRDVGCEGHSASRVRCDWLRFIKRITDIQYVSRVVDFYIRPVGIFRGSVEIIEMNKLWATWLG